jgi:pilus assembly protein CpaE
MTRAVIAVADQVIVQELRSRLDQSDAEVEVSFVAESTQEMVAAVLSHRPALLFVHDELRPGPIVQVVRDLTLRNPSLTVLIVSTGLSGDAYSAALDAGARAVLTHPFSLEDLNHRLAGVLEWNSSLRAAMSDRDGQDGAGIDRGARVIAVAGAKGGVGATVVASHLAWDAASTEPTMRVCLVDLDIENGDVPSYIDVSHRVSIADLAKISEDLTSRAVADTVVVHASGLHLLLAPNEIRDTEFVTPEAVRRIIAQLRTLYHLVIVDTGSAITTTQAAAVESADVTLQLVTADVPALRAARRQVVAWESLGVTSADSIRVVVNRFLRNSEIQQDTIDALTLGERSQILIPDLDRGLERAGNSRTPTEVRNQAWWKSLRAIGAELDTGSSYRAAVAASVRGGNGSSNGPSDAPSDRSGRGGGSAARRSKRRRHESGQATVETVALLPLALLIAVVCLEVVLLGLSVVWSGVAAGTAARAVSIGTSPEEAVRAALPRGVHSSVSVGGGGSRVTVTVRAPMLIGDGVSKDVNIGVNHQVVEEPR